MGKHNSHLRLVEPASASHRPVPAVAHRDVPRTLASLLLLAPVEAGASKAAELDGELLACCATARRVDQAADAVMDRLDDVTLDDPDVLDMLRRMRPTLDAYFEAVERAAEIPARTPEGLRAKAALLLLHLHSGEDCTALAGSLARDVAGRDRPLELRTSVAATGIRPARFLRVARCEPISRGECWRTLCYPGSVSKESLAPAQLDGRPSAQEIHVACVSAFD